MTPAAGRVLVTGASGFIGSALVRALVADGRSVVGFDLRAVPGTDTISGDIRDSDAVRRAMRGCDSVFHTAALYRFWARDPRAFYEVNVDGTRNVLAAAQELGVARVVYTSTVGTLGLHDDRPSGELDYPDVSHLFGSYKRSKYVAEHEVLRAAAEGAPVTLVLPTMPLGPADRAPTPSGKVVLDFLNGRMPGFVDTVLNIVHVDDVARGHVLAHDRGAVGRSYILGGENMTMHQLLVQLAVTTGRPTPLWRLPRACAVGVGWLSETVEGRLLRRAPRVPLEAARMSTARMAFDDSRARSELGYAPRPAVEAIADAARWFVEAGYVTTTRRRRSNAARPVDSGA